MYPFECNQRKARRDKKAFLSEQCKEIDEFTTVPNKGNAKESSKYHTIALISDAIKVMLKILQAKLQQYMN